MSADLSTQSAPAVTRPRSVSAGGKLAVIAPSGKFAREPFENGIAWLRERYEVSFSEDIYEVDAYHAGTAARRSAELIAALEDDSVDAIVCARGGFGATQLLPDLSLSAIQKANKMIIGFSDVTALHARWTEAGVASLHAPMVGALAKASPAVQNAWIKRMEDPLSSIEHEISPRNAAADSACVSGDLVGGNLAVLSALLGTPFAPKLEGKLLFLEDVGERPYRIDRLLISWKQSSLLNGIAGIVLGTFTDCKAGPDGLEIDDVFQRHFAEASVPMWSGLSSGHIEENYPLTLGIRYQVEGGRFFSSSL